MQDLGSKPCILCLTPVTVSSQAVGVRAALDVHRAAHAGAAWTPADSEGRGFQAAAAACATSPPASCSRRASPLAFSCRWRVRFPRESG